MRNSTPLGFALLLCLAVKHPLLLVAQQQQLVLSRDLAPPAFHTGTVFSSYSGSNAEDVDFTSLNLRQFDGMTATLYMGYGAWPSPDAPIDTPSFARLVDNLKASNNKVIHGHALVYPYANHHLDWWVQQPDNMVLTRMYQYIDAVASVRKGKIWIWDVVNEVMGDDDDDMDRDGVRKAFSQGKVVKEYKAIGQSYIAKAFLRARNKDPNALLLMTDYSCEEDDPTNINEKSDRLFRFVQKLKKQKIPVHGVGLQFHLSSIPGTELNYTRIVLNFQRFRNAGIPIYITELDVKSYKTTDPATVSTTDLQAAANRQALVYGKVMKICLNEPACKCLFMWDDAEYNSRNPDRQYSWLHPASQEDDPNSAPVYWFPTPFWDINPNNLSPKPAWYAMQNALANFTGVYRVTSLWKSTTSYLTRSGNATTPSAAVTLSTLNTQSSSWTSMKWRFERVDVGIYRIACTWGYTSGYLSRSGLQDTTTLAYNPADTVYLDSLHPDWWSQQWYIDYVYDNRYRITNRWGANGTLTRSGKLDQSGNVQPSNRVNLAATSKSWSSQIWSLERVWSAGDTKTAADLFWI